MQNRVWRAFLSLRESTVRTSTAGLAVGAGLRVVSTKRSPFLTNCIFAYRHVLMLLSSCYKDVTAVTSGPRYRLLQLQRENALTRATTREALPLVYSGSQK